MEIPRHNATHTATAITGKPVEWRNARKYLGIDKRAPKSRQAKNKGESKPQTGEPFKCPICRKRSIVGITAKIVADHDHHTGNIRDFICDSCNTGLGRFKNGEDYLQNAINYLKEHDTLK